MLFDYYDEGTKSFTVDGKVATEQRVAITSTCFSILALQAEAPGEHDQIIEDAYSSVLLANWRETDMFQAPLILKTILLGLQDQKKTTEFLQVRKSMSQV